MPLVTDDIEQARVAYSALELRAQTAEQLAASVQANLDDLRAQVVGSTEQARLFRQVTLDREAEVIQLRTQLDQTARITADLSLDNFIAALGLAAAIGEATMPDRIIPSVGVVLQAYLALSAGGVGLRFHTPELNAAAGLTTTSFEIAKVPPLSGGPAPRNLIVVLEEKQRVYQDPFWSKFDAVAGIHAEITKTLAATGAWSFGFLVQEAGAIAAAEKALAGQLAAAPAATPLTEFNRAIDLAQGLAATLAVKAVPVAGDLYMLSAALDNSTAAAKSLIP